MSSFSVWILARSSYTISFVVKEMSWYSMVQIRFSCANIGDVSKAICFSGIQVRLAKELDELKFYILSSLQVYI